MPTLGHDGTSGDTVRDVAEARVHVQHLGRHSLVLVSMRIVERHKEKWEGLPLSTCNI